MKECLASRSRREGMREAEALALTCSDLNLQLGAVRLDKNKAEDPRAWALDTGTANALRRYQARTPHRKATSGRVFVDPHGTRTANHVAARVGVSQ